MTTTIHSDHTVRLDHDLPHGVPSQVRLLQCDRSITELHAQAKELWLERTAYLAVGREGEQLVLGPLVIPPHSPCLGCALLQDELHDKTYQSLEAISPEEVEAALRRVSIRSLIGRRTHFDREHRLLQTQQLLRFSRCSACASAPFPNETFYATQLLAARDYA